ncbi:SDR family oxidoreductase [Streptomyces sp. ISL-111]|nr:SDR family oxidoreductase [Streptomyces sp. ISL-111]
MAGEVVDVRVRFTKDRPVTLNEQPSTSPAQASEPATAPARVGASGPVRSASIAAVRAPAFSSSRAVTANVVNPGPVETGWMNDELRDALVQGTPLGRLGTPRDTAHLVDFLCSPQGQWVNGQLLKSNGGAAP